MKRARLSCLALVLAWLCAAGPARAESYLGLLAGNHGTVADATVSATQTQLVCFAPPCSQSVAGAVRFNREHTAGIRGGVWYGTFGLAWEYTISAATSAAGPTSPGNVEINFDSLSLLALARTPALSSASLPDSYLYAGLGGSSVYGRFTVSAAPLPPMSGTASTAGLMFLGGGALRFSRHAMLFAEWRMQDLTFRSNMAGNSLNIPLKFSEIVLGAAYWY